MKGSLNVFGNVDELVNGALGLITDHLAKAICERGIATMVLSGGKTPRSVYEKMGGMELGNRIEWKKVHLFWGDERCVPPYMPESNYHMVKQTLLAHIVIPEENIHRIEAERSPHDAAQRYELEVRRFFGISEGKKPVFDLVLLGLGEDGHTASLFPGNSAVSDHDRLVVAPYVENLTTHRVTLTLQVINNAEAVIFLVSGASKSAILRDVLEDSTPRYPAQLVNPASGNLLWLVDREAASLVHATPSL